MIELNSTFCCYVLNNKNSEKILDSAQIRNIKINKNEENKKIKHSSLENSIVLTKHERHHNMWMDET